MKYNEDGYVLCPFYRKETKCSIYCEGIIDYSTNIVYLGNEKKRHKEEYCKLYYYKCPLHNSLIRKYN